MELKVETRLISSLEDFLSIEESWNKIYLSTDKKNPFLSWEWNRLWITNFGELSSVKIVLVQEKSEILAIAPFSLTNKKITFLSDPFFADYADLMCTESIAFITNEIIKVITSSLDWQVIDLQTIPETSETLPYLIKALSKHTPYSETILLSYNPYITTSANYTDYYQSRKKSLRSEMVRTRNSLDKTYKKWDFIQAKTVDEKLDIYSALVDFHLDRQNAKIGTSIFDNSMNIEFFKNLLQNKNLPWQIDMSAVKADGKFITASISIIDNKSFYYWIPSFDRSFSKGSIGNFHIMLLLEECFKSNINRFDFMGGNESYKLKWSDESYKNYRILSYKSYFTKFRADLIKNFINILKKHKENIYLRPIWIKISKLVGK